MKLCRIRQGERIIPALQMPDALRDLSSEIADFDRSFFESGGMDRLRHLRAESFPVVNAHDGYAPVVASPSKIVCVGLNYHAHAREAGMGTPTEPVLFLKAPSALCGANDPILYPPDATKLDWEVELAMVIGRRARHVSEATAMDCVAGFTVFNDISERSYQNERGGQWTKGKSYDSFAPAGPWLVTPDEVADPHALELTLLVNDETMQRGSSADLIFRLPSVIAYISRHMTLEPGDIVTTGTPEGVGLGRKPPRFLKPGDTVTARILGLGEQKQVVVAERF